MDEKVKEVFRTNFIVSTLLYSIIMMQFPQGSDENLVKDAIDKWSKESTDKLIQHLENSGFTIVPKEPALEVFRPSNN